MANITITESGGLFSISLDGIADGWTGLTVNGAVISYSDGWNYQQTVNGPVSFIATSSLTQVSLPDAIIIQSPPGSTNTYVAVLEYILVNGTLQLNGTLLTVGAAGNGFTSTQAVGDPVAFDQPSVTGSFSAS
jgi:hypothetical protein